MADNELLRRHGLDEAEIQSRRAFFEIGDDDLRRLSWLREFADKYTQQIVDDLYVLILGHPDSRKLFPDEATVRRVKSEQREYFANLFAGRCDLAYAEDRLRIGVVHERVGLPPKWYLGAYSRYLRTTFAYLASELRDPDEMAEAIASVLKLVTFDITLAIDAYIRAQVDSIQRHEAAFRELSTPVVQLYHEVLLMPLIGTIDTQRAEQLMEAILVKVVEDQARVIIIDIAGVPVIDTKVAKHLLKTTAAVRLLGAETILSGVTPTLAKTVIDLKLDIAAMHTRSRLADALRLALELIGEAVQPVAAGSRPTEVAAATEVAT